MLKLVVYGATMDAVREKWTDERLDDLVKRMDEGFREGREDLRQLRTEMNGRFDAMEARFDRMQQLMIAALLTIVLGFVVDKI
jgi:ribosome recycling factor